MAKGFPITLSVDELMAKARGITGIDIVDHAAIEPLTVLHRSLCEDAGMHEAGAKDHTAKLLRLLCNRLRMQRDYARHPEIADEVIRGPVIVFGMARSGTTKTQKVLAATGDFNFLHFWQSYNFALFTGDRNESPEPRIREADDWCRWYDAATPGNRAGHPYETFEPEEELMINEHSLCEPGLMAVVHIPQYLEWCATQDPAVTFTFMRDAVKYLQWQGFADPARTWLLKGANYFGVIPIILRLFPNARFVMAHRSSLETVPSSFKLMTTMRAGYGAPIVPREWLVEGFRVQMATLLEFRRTRPDVPILDLSFAEITRDSANAMRKVYAHAGMTMSDAARARIEQWDRDNPMHRKGMFSYSLEEFGWTAEQVEGAMGEYEGWMRQRFGN